MNQCSHLIDETIGFTGVVEDEVGLAQPFDSSRLMTHPAADVRLVHPSETEPLNTNAVWYIHNDPKPPSVDEITQNRHLHDNDISFRALHQFPNSVPNLDLLGQTEQPVPNLWMGDRFQLAELQLIFEYSISEPLSIDNAVDNDFRP